MSLLDGRIKRLQILEILQRNPSGDKLKPIEEMPDTQAKVGDDHGAS